MGCHGIHKVSKGLQQNSTLKILSLANNDIPYHSLQFLEVALSNMNCALIHLSIGQNKLCGSRSSSSETPYNPKTLMSFIEGCFLPNKVVYLKSIDFSYSDIGARSAGKLMSCMKEIDSVEILDLTGCNITVQGCQAVGEALPHLKRLYKLKLGFNSIGPIGSEVSRITKMQMKYFH